MLSGICLGFVSIGRQTKPRLHGNDAGFKEALKGREPISEVFCIGIPRVLYILEQIVSVSVVLTRFSTRTHFLE